MTGGVIDERRCLLGEGPLWHPDRGRLMWFDILGNRLMEEGGAEWDMGEHASAAALTSDPDRLLIATETGLHLWHLGAEARETVCALEADRPETRSNDGRADPWGGFWIGTMGKRAELRAGGIHRWFRGEIRTLHPGITIPNAICFDRERARAFFADTRRRVVMRQALDPDTGWPDGEAEPHIDLRAEGLNPDGAVIDAEGCLWNAQWGAARVARYDPDGRFLEAVGFPAAHTSCPAFGGDGLTTLCCTTARELLPPEREREAVHGRTYAARGAGRGLPEPRVIL